MNMHIISSGPELQAVRFEYVISGENGGKGADPIGLPLLPVSVSILAVCLGGSGG